MTAVHAVLADGTVAHEDKRMYQCAAAEVVAGCIRGFTRGTTSAAGDTPGDALTEQLWEHIMPLLELQLADTSLDSSVDWCDAVRLCYDTSTAADSAAAAATAALLEPLTLLLCSNVQAVLSSTAARDDFAEQTLWLRLLQPALIELAAGPPDSANRAQIAAETLCPLLLQCLGHPYKGCRAEIARCLFLLLCFAKPPQSWLQGAVAAAKTAVLGTDIAESAAAVLQALTVGDAPGSNVDSDVAMSVDDVSSSSISASNSASSSDTAAAAAVKARSLRMETVLLLLHQAVSVGDSVLYLQVLVPLLPSAFECVRDANLETAALGKFTCMCIAQALHLYSRPLVPTSNGDSDMQADEQQQQPLITQLVHTVAQLATQHSSWQVRTTAAAFAGVFATQHLFSLTAAEHRELDAALLQSLGDSRREVSQQACAALTTRIAMLDAAAVRTLCARFVTAADGIAAAAKKRRKLARRAGIASGSTSASSSGATGVAAVSSEEETASAQLRMTSVLGLSAIVGAYPYDVPPYVPQALVALSRHADAGLHVKETVTHTFKEFKRLHQDNWAVHSQAFTADQLD
eukprot:7098-Heterococcus_DN1.PRE.1